MSVEVQTRILRIWRLIPGKVGLRKDCKIDIWAEDKRTPAREEVKRKAELT